MRVLFAPRPPASVRQLLEARRPSQVELHFCSEDDPAFDAELAQAECLLGVPRRVLDAAFLERAPKLQLIQLLRKGVDKVDLPIMKAAEVRVATIGDATACAVAEHTMMLMLAVCRKLRWQHAAVAGGRWGHAKPWQLPAGQVDSVPDVPFQGLSGLRLGLLGMGNIGTRVAKLADAFGMQVSAATATGVPGSVRDGVPLVRAEELLADSDVLSLHLSLTNETRSYLGAERLARMKPGAFLINTARGALVDEAALIAALDRGHLAGAGLDCLAVEPPNPQDPLLGREDVVLTPHTGWLSANSWDACIELGYDNILRFEAGDELANSVA